jgi:2-iminoacetate synthase
MKTLPTTFLDYDRLREAAETPAPSGSELDDILDRALQLRGLTLEDAAALLNIEEPDRRARLLETAARIKREIYGRRMVLFAPLYAGNHCSNNCLYCGFRRDNAEMPRRSLSMEEIEAEAEALLRQGHKRLLLLTGESERYPIEYTRDAIAAAYRARHGSAGIRRINVELAPMEIDEFRQLAECAIGTYTCFQETYDPELYARYHPAGPKSDYRYRLEVMDRAMEAGIDDVGIGVLYGLADYRFDTLAVMAHGRHLEERYGCGPHTVSVPRLEPAAGAPVSTSVPYPVSDEQFKQIVAVIRMAMPYTGIILSTREEQSLRTELFRYGVSQVSAGSRTAPGAYEEEEAAEREAREAQFTLGDHRSLEEVIRSLTADGYIPSFCTGCYRRGRVGADFMDLAKPGLIKQFCTPNAMLSFAEYLYDYAGEETRRAGLELIEALKSEVPGGAAASLDSSLQRVARGERDLYR